MVGTLLTRRIKKVLGVKPTGGCSCKRTAFVLDTKSVRWIRSNRWLVADQIVRNARKGLKKQKVHAELRKALTETMILSIPTWVLKTFLWILLTLSVRESVKKKHTVRHEPIWAASANNRETASGTNR